ncbi:hypothetical protein F383_14323 [Gossypium arboreum]|uniref:Uncharacterized protein n=1 Tax=Gossypium arboreum TaxID=29729 RepID=A0A0B0N9I9_GOSAR|nr:hypothetical protein F383_14323 [Gossypium arboreum]
MSLGLLFRSRSCMCCELTAARMSLPYIISSIELIVHQLRRSLPIIAQKS